MMTEQTRSTSRPDEADLERLLRDFYAAEMPAALSAGTAAADDPSCRAAVMRKDDRRPRPVARALGLTAVLAALMLALSALWSPSRTTESAGGTDLHANDAGVGGRNANPVGEPPTGPSRSQGVSGKRRPIELQGQAEGGVPVGVDGRQAADGGSEFPELDIRILPIDDDR